VSALCRGTINHAPAIKSTANKFSLILLPQNAPFQLKLKIPLMLLRHE